MYAVITEGRLTFLGECQNQALETFNAKPHSSLHCVDGQDELAELLEKVEEERLSDPDVLLSEAFVEIVGKLDEMGLNQDLAEKIRDKGDKLVGEVRNLGTKGMETVGEGFIALGELLRKGIKPDEECRKGNDCCKHDHGGES